jgi:hypothetical protein
MEVNGQFHALAAVLPEKDYLVPIKQGLGGPQSQSRRCGEAKNLLALSEIEPRFLGCLVCNLIFIPNQLSQRMN